MAVLGIKPGTFQLPGRCPNNFAILLLSLLLSDTHTHARTHAHTCTVYINVVLYIYYKVDHFILDCAINLKLLLVQFHDNIQPSVLEMIICQWRI